MAINELTQVINTLRDATLRRDEVSLTDGQLLDNYIRSREEAAFAAIVRRHGAMVWGVCRRVLRGHQDAEDAFQATFLVLVRKASSIVPKEMVGNWLYGVAHQTALKARATTFKRRTREKQVTVMPEPTIEQEELRDELQPLLDEELSRLPNKYRAVIVLCDLEGKTRKEAARHLDLPEGTVASRLATARTMLGNRLARGLPVASAALAAVLSQTVASASVPVAVTSATIKAASLFAAGQAAVPGAISVKAVALAEGVLRTMLLTKLKLATAALVVLAVLGTSAIALTQQVLAEKRSNSPAQERHTPADPPAQELQSPAAKPQAANEEEAPASAKQETPRMRQRFLDLQSHANQKLGEDFVYDRNNLTGLPIGEQTLGGVKFNIGEGLIRLTWEGKPTPKKVEGIQVDAKFTTLHVLHATHWSAKEKDVVVGYYTLNYEDNSKETIPIMFGRDVSNWWRRDNESPPSVANVVWKGANDAATKIGQSKIQLYVASWRNPHPTRRVVSIDFSSTRPDITPFCVAITVEE
jgi:RNA polymerase sigma factor (sigma-70 family)